MDVLKTLFLPFANGSLSSLEKGQDVLFINGQCRPALQEHLSLCNLTVQQHFKPYADALEKNGYQTTPFIPEEGAFDLVIVLGGKQQKETHYFVAQALQALKPRGTIICAAANDMGGKRLGKDFKALNIPALEESKHHARVVWGKKPERYNEELINSWHTDGDVQSVRLDDHTFVSQPGIFGWNKIDKGSALLAEHLPKDLSGTGADFGCGYGFLSHHLLHHHAGIKALYALDADIRAVHASQKNLEHVANNTAVHTLWADLTKPASDLPRLDWIVMNPPFHEGKATENTIGKMFIETAAQTLKPGGVLYMVANAHLPYETLLGKGFKQVDKMCEEKGFKVFKATRQGPRSTQ